MGVVATWAMRQIAPLLGYLDYPGRNRFHEKTTPLLGGAGVFVAILLVSMAAGEILQKDYKLFYIGLCTLFALGLVDDKLGMSPLVKLAGQFFVGLAFYFAGLRLELVDSELANACIGIVWVVGIVNAMNLLDNIDGLCGTITLVGSLVFAWMLAAAGNTALALLAAVTAGATLGFLGQNFPHAKIFLGDAGSMLLGGLLAGFGLAAVQPGNIPSHLAVTLVLAMPILDTSLVVTHRLLNGRKVLEGGKDHLSHRLSNHFHLGPTRAVLVIALGGVGGGLLATWLWQVPLTLALPLWGVCLMAGIGLVAALKGSYDYHHHKGLRPVPTPGSPTKARRVG